jgi:hypothetical protein
MSNTTALIEEVKRKLRKYSDAGLLDENSMYREIVLGLKKFGNSVCELHEEVVHVKNGKAELPSNFNSLSFAYLCEPLGYEKDQEVELHDLQSSYFYTERVETSDKWNECDPCCKEQETKTIKESLYFKNGKVDFYYTNPRLLRISTKSLNKNEIHSKCRNRAVRTSNEVIDINKRTLNANFKEGYIYINYFGLPMDEDGKIEIPDTYNGDLEKYMEYRLLSEVTLDLMGNNDSKGIQSLYQEYRRLESLNLKNATNDLKMNAINPNELRRRFRRLNNLEAVKYEAGTWP